MPDPTRPLLVEHAEHSTWRSDLVAEQAHLDNPLIFERIRPTDLACPRIDVGHGQGTVQQTCKMWRSGFTADLHERSRWRTFVRVYGSRFGVCLGERPGLGKRRESLELDRPPHMKSEEPQLDRDR